jgi:general stress protein 26
MARAHRLRWSSNERSSTLSEWQPELHFEAMTLEKLLGFAQRHTLAVQTSVALSGPPQAAVVGIVTNDRFEFFFDTLKSSRKCQNLRRDPRTSLVIGWDLEQACTLQIEGVADEPSGAELERWLELYLTRFPDGHERRGPAITYFRVRPNWMRFSDFRSAEPLLVEYSGQELSGSSP